MKSKTSGKTAAVVAGIAGLAAAVIAGGYFFYGKDGAKHRKNLKTWSIKAKAEVMDKLGKVKDLSEDNYNEIVDLVSAKYSAVKTVAPDEIQAFARDLKKHWKDIKKELVPKASKAKKTPKK